MTEAAPRDTPKRDVVLVGRNDFQNKLLAHMITERIGCSCLVRSVEGLSGPAVDANVLVLLDVAGVAARDIKVRLQVLATRASVHNIALINADEGVSFEQIVAWPGIKGIFFRETSERNFVKGILAIFKGEYWLSRKMLFAHWEQTSAHKRLFAAERTLLTRKEIDTLKLLVGGHSNNHIAHTLNVSPHTVKTHIYNLYRKLRVGNRVQAVHWALQNIEGVGREFTSPEKSALALRAPEVDRGSPRSRP
jgi:LuxR family transcriptional regulator, positive regulator of biofilm formation